jgi:hypothetical protein
MSPDPGSRGQKVTKSTGFQIRNHSTGPKLRIRQDPVVKTRLIPGYQKLPQYFLRTFLLSSFVYTNLCIQDLDSTTQIRADPDSVPEPTLKLDQTKNYDVMDVNTDKPDRL